MSSPIDVFSFKLSDSPSITIKSIECSELKNVEYFGNKNDVYVTFDWCGGKFRTETKQDAGDKAAYDNKDMIIKPPVTATVTQPMSAILTICVYDENSIRSDAKIGKVELNMSSLELNIEKVFTLDIHDTKEKEKTGTIKVVLLLIDDQAVTSRATRDVEISDEHEPFVEDNSNNNNNDNMTSPRNSILDNPMKAISAAMSSTVSTFTSPIKAAISSSSPPAAIAESSSSSSRVAAPSSLSHQPITATADVEAAATSSSPAPPPAVPVLHGFNYALPHPCLTLKRIECMSLKSVEYLGGKNDVYVLLDWCGTKFRTETKNGAGANAVFINDGDDKNTNSTMRLQPAAVSSMFLTISVFDSNATRSHVLIGKATDINLASSLLELNKETELIVDIYEDTIAAAMAKKLTPTKLSSTTAATGNSSISGKTKTGTIKLLCVMENIAIENNTNKSRSKSKDFDIDNDSYLNGFDSLKGGDDDDDENITNNDEKTPKEPVIFPLISPPGIVLQIKNIVCSGIKNVEFMGRNDLYVKVKWGDAKLKTQIQNDVGNKAVFDSPGMILKPKKVDNGILTVKVYDDNTSTLDVLIGESTVDIAAGVGMVKEMIQGNDYSFYYDTLKTVTVDIVDKHSVKTGTVSLTVLLKSAHRLAKMDHTILSQPNLKVQFTRIECTKLKNKRKIGLSKNDVYVEMKWSNIASFKTDILINAGDKAVFIEDDEDDDEDDKDKKKYKTATTTEKEKEENENEDDFYKTMVLKPTATPTTTTLLITVYDASQFRAAKMIGECFLDLSPLALGVEKEYPVMDIYDKHGEITGHVKLKGLLTIQKIKGYDESGLFSGKTGSGWTGSSKKGRSKKQKKQHLNDISLWESIQCNQSQEAMKKNGNDKNYIIAKSIRYENENYKFIVAYVAIIFLCLLDYIMRIFFYFIGYQNMAALTFFSTKYMLSCIGFSYILVLFMLATFHRVVGWSVGFWLRQFMKESLKYNGKWDLHFGWISIRGFLDKIQVVVHHAVWRNPEKFAHTPYFAYIHEVTVTMSPQDIYEYLTQWKVLRIMEAVVDNAEAFIEKSNEDDGDNNSANDMNLWACLGMDEKKTNTEEEVKKKKAQKKYMTDTFFAFVSKIKKQISLGSTLSMTTSASLPSKRNIIASKIQEEEADEEKEKQKTIEKDKTTNPENGSGSISNSSKQQHLASDNKLKPNKTPPAAEVKPLIIDLHRLIIYKLNAHVLDFVTPKHATPVASSDVRVTQLIATRKDFTDKNPKRSTLSFEKYWGEEEMQRVPLELNDFIQKLIDVAVGAIVSENWDNVAALLAQSAASNTYAAMSDSVSAVAGVGGSAWRAMGFSSKKDTTAALKS